MESEEAGCLRDQAYRLPEPTDLRVAVKAVSSFSEHSSSVLVSPTPDLGVKPRSRSADRNADRRRSRHELLPHSAAAPAASL
jgi:hypothetical protein